MASQSNNPYLLTLPQLISVKKKIGQLAAFHDHEKTSLKAFDSEQLNPTQFREQLRRTFGIEITNAELGAIVLYCDKDGDGNISSSEFRKEFFRLGKEERMKHMLSHQEEKRRIAAARKRKEDEREQRMLEMVKFKMADSWSKEEEESAVRKITEVAFSYDPNQMGGLGGFINGGDLDPTQFREQLKRNFQIILSAGELAAIFDKFDSDKNGTIDCSEFLFHFFRMGRAEKDLHRARNAHRTYVLQQEAKKREIENKRKMELGAQALVLESTDDDRLSFERKLTQAAKYYEKKSWLGRSAALDGVAMTPTVFKEQLKQNFDILVTPAELDAAVKWFNRDGSVPEGMVETKYFLAVFFRMSQEEKSNIIMKTQSRNAQIEKSKRDYEKKAIEDAQKRAETKIEWPVLPPAPGSKGASRNVSRNGTPARHKSTDSLPSLPSFASAGSADAADKKKEKKTRKMSMVESIDPLREQREAMKTMSSFGDLFPHASNDTKDFLKEIEAKEDLIDEMNQDSVAQSRSNTTGSSRPATKKKSATGKKKKTKKRKQSKSSSRNAHSRPNSEGGSTGFSPEREQEEVDFAEEMRVQFRPFDDSTNLTERPLSRHDRASSREGRGEDKEPPPLGGEMANMFGNPAPSAAPRAEPSSGSATPIDSFQNVPLEEVGKNREFYHKRPPKDPNAAPSEGEDTDEYDDDCYEDEFDD